MNSLRVQINVTVSARCALMAGLGSHSGPGGRNLAARMINGRMSACGRMSVRGRNDFRGPLLLGRVSVRACRHVGRVVTSGQPATSGGSPEMSLVFLNHIVAPPFQ